MGALSLPKPRNTNQYGRDPESASERLRSKTNYSAGKGYAPLFHAMVADLARLSRGASCTHLILAILSLQDRSGKDGWTPALSLAEWADLAKCDEKEIQRNRDYLKARKMSDCKVDTKRLYSFRLRPETWEPLEDYTLWLKKQKVEDEAATATGDDAAPGDPTKPGNWRMSKPVKVARGKRSQPLTPDCGIARIVFCTPGDTPEGIDIAYFGMVKAGDLFITPTVTLAKGAEKAKTVASSKVRSKHEDMDVLGDPRKRGDRSNVAVRVKNVTHPRAAELISLFDPLLAHSAARLLSGDLPSLEKACAALADCDHDYLVKFAVQRAERPVKSPMHVPAICKEARESWEQSKRSPAPRIEPKKQGFVEGVMDAARRRLEKYGRI